jgi:lipoate-protein ligase A
MALLPERPQPALRLDRSAPEDALEIEQGLLDQAAEGRAVSAVWEPLPSIIVPASYRRYERFGPLCERFASRGWPVSVRRSGGGLVPQGPGMVNVSLAWRSNSAMGEAMEPVYLGLCRLLQRVIAPFELDTALEAVEGSFCDGRYNLTLGSRKVAGTAQYWRRVSATEHVVLAHACLLVEADLAVLNRLANEFEAQLGSDRQYRLEAIANLAPSQGPRPTDAIGQPLNAGSLACLLREAARESEVLC